MEDFVINGKGVLTEYNGDATFIEIPAGVKTIGKNFLGYRNGENVKTVIVPDSVKVIEGDAFDQFCRFNIEMSINCPLWPTYGTAKKYGFARSLINRDGSTLSFRDAKGKIVAKVILAIKEETEPKVNRCILAINNKQDGRFDFAGYDGCFGILGKNPNKLRMAMLRLRYPYELSDEMKDVYLEFLKKQSANAGMVLIDENDMETISFLGMHHIFSASSIKKLIEYAASKEKVDMVAWLLEYDNTNYARSSGGKVKSIATYLGSTLDIEMKKQKNTIEKETQKKLLGKKTERNGEKNMATWRKPKAGTSLVPRYQGNETSVLFPTEVDGIKITGIANTAGDAPENYKKIKEVVIPEGYTYIGNKAFSGCENLETISLPSTIREIGTGAFAGCKKLKEIIIKKDVSFVGKNVFVDSYIKVVVFETEKNMKIPSHLFFGCHIDNLVVYGGPFKSNGNVFDYTGVSAGVAYAEELYDGNFPEAVYINDDFSTLDLKGVGGGNAKKIHPLSDIDEAIIMSESVRSVIASEKTKKGKVVDNANKITETTEVESIDFCNSVFVLAGFDYDEEWQVTAEIEQRGGTLKDNVSASINYLVVPDRELVKNSKIKKVMELQAKGKNISVLKISECRRNMRIHDEKIFGIEGAKIAADYRLSIDEGNVTLNKYLGNDVEITIPEKIGDFPIVALGTKCFEEGYGSEHKSMIKSITIPSAISVIPKGAFDNCNELSTVILSEGLVTISQDAFLECDGLVEIKLPSTVEVIENGAFSRCRNLKKIFIPASVMNIGNPFSGCDSLMEIVVAEDNETFDSRNNCNAIVETATNTIITGCKNTVIPASVTVIGDGAFGGIDTITEFVVPEGITEIGNGAFSGCMKLSSIKFADSVEKIGNYAFHFCNELEKIELPSKLKEISISSLANCQKLTELTIGDSLKEISDLDRAWSFNVRISKVCGSANSIARAVAESLKCEYIEI